MSITRQLASMVILALVGGCVSSPNKPVTAKDPAPSIEGPEIPRSEVNTQQIPKGSTIADPLIRKFKTLRWIAYSPSTGNPLASVEPSLSEIAEDLLLLRGYGFQGLVTYGANGNLGAVPAMARASGFEGIVMGIWDPANESEISSALKASAYVDGYCVGNEGLSLGTSRYNKQKLEAALSYVRSKTGKPVTTTEERGDYGRDTWLARTGDWCFPNIHPYWAGVKSPVEAVLWTSRQHRQLSEDAQGRVVVLKETGFPTGGDEGVNEETQRQFYQLMETAGIPFVYFEAFDQRWKDHEPVEPYWGLFDSERSPKAMARYWKKPSRKPIKNTESIAESEPSPEAAIEEAEVPTVEIRFASLQDEDNVSCMRTNNGGQIQLNGSVKGIHRDHYQLLLFCYVHVPAARGWYVQFEPNGISDWIRGDKWRGIVQLGNRRYPPVGGERIDLAVLAVPKEEARRIIEQGRRRPDRPLRTLPVVEKDHAAIVQNLMVKVE